MSKTQPEIQRPEADYEVVQMSNGQPLDHQLASYITSFRLIEGLCAANQDNPTQPRDGAWYLEHVIAPLLRDEKIDDGTRTPYDDRKFRCDNLRLDGTTLEMALGISHFQAFRADLRRSPEENKALQERGYQDYHDRWAYFQRNPGVAGLVLSREGRAYLGERVANADAPGRLNSVAGHVDYKENVREVNLQQNLRNELQEEMGIRESNLVDLRFVGAYGHPLEGHFDFTWIVRTSLSNSYFAERGAWREQRTSKEHESLVALTSIAEVKSLLDSGIIRDENNEARKYQIMYSTRGALESLREEDFQAI